MKNLANKLIRLFLLIFAFSLMFASALDDAFAQDRPEASQRELDQMLAPIALYPDALLSQILMAATYPAEVDEAARWSRDHPNLTGDDAVRAVADEDWDPSVKSLVAFPQVLARMAENPQWMESLGDAFLDQQPQVMDTVQNLRRRAEAAGNLRSDDRIRVVESGPTVVVEYVNPQVVYVPYYDPLFVYGPWWWPSYRPVYWRPWPGYYARPGFTFYWGAPIGISAGFFFGGCDWQHRQVRVVRVNNYYYNNVTINRRDPINQTTVVNVNRAPGVWQHDPAHRRGVAYQSVQLQQRFGGANTTSDRFRRESGAVRPPVSADRGDRPGGVDIRRREIAPQPNLQPRTQVPLQPQAPQQLRPQFQRQPQVAPPATADTPGANRDRGDHADHDRPRRHPETQGAIPAPAPRESRGNVIEMRREAVQNPQRFRAPEPPAAFHGNRREDRPGPFERPQAPQAPEPRAISRPRPEAPPRVAEPPARPPQFQSQPVPPGHSEAHAEKKQERANGRDNRGEDRKGRGD